MIGKFTGPPKACQKCGKRNFDKMDWPNRDGTAESVFFCSGCGRVYEPQPIDTTALRAALVEALKDYPAPSFFARYTEPEYWTRRRAGAVVYTPKGTGKAVEE